MGNRASAGSGGSGAGYHAIIKIDSPQIFRVICGSGGISYGGPKGANRTGTNGASSSFSVDANDLISAGGGTGGFAAGAYQGAKAGSGGVLNVSSSLNEIASYLKNNGKNGRSSTSSSSASASGAESVFSGHTWGASGNCGASSNSGYANSSYNGYVLIKYLGQDNPVGE